MNIPLAQRKSNSLLSCGLLVQVQQGILSSPQIDEIEKYMNEESPSDPCECDEPEKCTVRGGDEPCSHNFDNISWPKATMSNTEDSNAVSIESTTLFALLESRHETMLQWCEPWPACGPEGNDLDAHIILRATIHDCINMQRRVAKAAGRPTASDDENHLLDFMAIHWARVVEANALAQTLS